MFMFVLGPVGIAFFLGIVVGWSWKPTWVKNQSNQNLHHPSLEIEDIKNAKQQPFITLLSRKNPNCSSASIVKKEEKHQVVPRDEDLKHLWHLVERKDGGVPWKHMMDRSTHTMHYQAWQRDPPSGPPQYCSKTVYENATPQLMRDFLWDDDFRLKWDDMLIHAATVEEFPTTGSSVVHWIRKFPFFCSDREYTISRRMWELEGSYYCVTKGVPCLSIPRKQKPLRVDLYYSSWFIKPVESKIGNQAPACEVTFFHHEDMKIPWEIAKFGVRQGMWGAAKKVECGFRSYQKERAISKAISLHVVMAQMSTKIDKTHLPSSLEPNEEDLNLEKAETQVEVRQQKPMMVPKLLIIGGAIMVACSIDSGLLTKAVIFGIAKRFASIGRQPCPPP